MTTKSKHRHRWQMESYGGNPLTLGFVCSCGSRKSRQATKDEVKTWRAYLRAWPRANMHKVPHKVHRALEGKHGYGAMLAAERLAKKYPDRVFIARCDDDHHSSSRLVFVTHEDENDQSGFSDYLAGVARPAFFGTTVFYIGQANTDVRQFFLYDNHVTGLLGVLTKLDKRASAYDRKRPRKVRK